jgi:hypothetical protein
MLHIRTSMDHSRSSRDARSIDGDAAQRSSRGHMESPSIHDDGIGQFTSPLRSVTTSDAVNTLPSISSELTHTTTGGTLMQGHTRTQSDSSSNLHKFTKALNSLSNRVGSVKPDLFDDSQFRSGEAANYPEIPGEIHRNAQLPLILERYNPRRDASGNVTPMVRESRSRTRSFNDENSPTTPRSRSPLPPQSPRSPSPLPSPTTADTAEVRRPSRRDTLEVPQSPHSPTSLPSPTDADIPRVRRPSRQDTLEVPPMAHLNPTRSNQSIPLVAVLADPEGVQVEEPP